MNTEVTATSEEGVEELDVSGWDIQPEDDGNVAETATIEELRDDLEQAHKALRKILSINVAQFPGGPNNKHFGNKFLPMFGRAQEVAKKEMLAQVQREIAREQRLHEVTEVTDVTDSNEE